MVKSSLKMREYRSTPFLRFIYRKVITAHPSLALKVYRCIVLERFRNIEKAPSRDHFQDGAFLLWIRANIAAAGSVMFMLRLGEIPEEWTYKRSVADLASAMSLRVDSVWQQVNGAEVLTKITDVKPGDRIVIRAARALI